MSGSFFIEKLENINLKYMKEEKYKTLKESERAIRGLLQ